jgi:hypothetical protein
MTLKTTEPIIDKFGLRRVIGSIISRGIIPREAGFFNRTFGMIIPDFWSNSEKKVGPGNWHVFRPTFIKMGAD